MNTNEIVVMLTNKGYVAIENRQIFDLWKRKSLKDIFEELQQRYPKYKINLGSLNHIEFQDVVEVSNQYLTSHNEFKLIKSQSINLKKNNKMKQLTFNTKTAKTLVKVSTGFTTQKITGMLHLTLQAGADMLQSGADTVALGEAKILTKLNIYNESETELITIRKERTIGYQEMIKQTPRKLFQTSKVIKDKFENLMKNQILKSVNQ